ncbi:hypothetical protein [Micromonospora endolithica]|uniref:DUF4878 domain-containing protein n=1 Tax=Micromonospora endolithica TaxID=230091 RepID=A0A3A9YTV1_9ACTN|nr:hypothetical protein [Micromonospora endolithica]RKN38676.1 hypothetical protein D7223_30620 [Micromonospora endolithica]
MFAARIALAVLPVLAVVSCSEGRDPGHRPGAEGVREIIPLYTRALADGDGPKACSLMSKAAQEALAKRAANDDCLQSVKSVANRLDQASAAALREVKMKDPQVNAGKATVELQLDGSQQGAIDALGSTTLTLVQIDERWHIDAVPAG